MNVIDLNIFDIKPFAIKIKTREYKVTYFPAKIELELMQNQEGMLKKLTKLSSISKTDHDNWKRIITRLLVENDNEVVGNDVEDLQAIQLIAVMNLLYTKIGDKASKLQDIFKDDEDDSNDEKKKTMK